MGMMLMASARSLVMMYLALEFTSVTSYILAGMLRHNRKSAEASLKYIIYGGGASGVMVFGMAYLYGMTGSLDVDVIGQKIAAMGAGFEPRMALVISVLVMAGFGYKIAAVPFHMWCPDVYEGAPTPVTAFFSVGPKAAGFAMLARFLAGVFGLRADVEVVGGRAVVEPFGGPMPEWTVIMALLAVFTMALGNFVAIHQNNLKRLLAYSSIAHAGYMLLAFTIFTSENMASLLFYIVVYIIMNLGAFFLVIVLEERYKIETVEGCAGLGWREPGLCGLMTLFLISLTGLPPTAGFIGKMLIFGYLVKGGPFGVSLAVVGVLFSAISLYYYARIIMAMFLRPPAEGALPSGRPVGAVMPMAWALGLATLVFGLSWDPIYELARLAGRTIV
jgi:NADH-quinone oxidoreductase subunit N